MKMRSPLFTRILAWFVGIVLLSAVGLYGILLLDPKPRRENRFLRAEMETAIWLYEHSAPSELKLYMDRQDAILGGLHRLLDSTGTDVLTGECFPDALSVPIQQDERRGLLSLSEKPARVVRAAASDGKYHFVVWMRQGGPNGPSAREWRIFLWTVATVVLFCYVLATTMARPIRALRQAVLQFGGGDLSRRSPLKRNDEIGDLGHAFDQMADRIQTLLTAERRLLQDISHELRTPLARMGFAVELARASKDPRASLDRIKREADRLTALVNELIEMARAEGDPRERRNERVDLAGLIGNLVEDFEPEVEGKGCRIQTAIGAHPAVCGDSALIERAVGNLISNAIRYAPQGTAVEVGVRETAGMVEITVRDQGPGVPESQLDDILKPFYRVDESRDRLSGGVGLGLAIARRTALLHHGDLRAANANPGLRVTLSLAASAMAAPAAGVEAPEPVLRG